MKVEAVKKGNHYIIPYFDKINLKQEKIELEFDEKIIQNQNKKREPVKKGTTYKKYSQLSAELNGDELIDMIISDMPEDYKYSATAKTEKEIWYEEIKKKYE